MQINRVFSNYTFRFMSVCIAGLNVIVLIILSLIYAVFSYGHFKHLDNSIAAEIKKLSDVYIDHGLEGVNLFIEEKTKSGKINLFFYLIVDQSDNKLAGNFDLWPAYKQDTNNWLNVQIETFSESERQASSNFIVNSTKLDGSYQLLVARDYSGFIVSSRLVSNALISSVIIAIVLGVIGGAIITNLSIQQTDSINNSTQRIISGNLSERITTVSYPGDYRETVFNLNRMLNYMQSLINNTRPVTDNIAHDLRTPIVHLRNKMVELQAQVSEVYKGKINSLIDRTDYLLSMFNSLLRIAYIESGDQRASFIELSLQAILSDVVEFYEPLALEKSITIETCLNDHIVLFGNKDLLFQAFANVIDNAIKYTQIGGELLMSLSCKNNNAIVVIADNGRGISDSNKAKVFERFFRVDPHYHKLSGSGLGLSLVYAAIKLHDGDIGLYDNDPGLKIEISLPLLGQGK